MKRTHLGLHTGVWARITPLLLALGALVTSSAAATGACLTPPGDVSGNGATNIADVQCCALVNLWQLAGGAGGGQTPPSCAFGGPTRADLNCSGVVTIEDVTLSVTLAIGASLSPLIDSNGNYCADACEAASAVCGNSVLEVGEECDDGPANSDALADFCRTDCTLPGCGDSVVDSGEQCDDGNLVNGDGCEDDCSLTGGTALGLPYSQSFDTGSYATVAWTVESDAASSSNNWALTTSGPLGADKHPRFFRLPQVTNYQDRIISPVLDASGATHVTLRYDRAIVLNGADAQTTFRILASSNGGSVWQTAWQRAGADGNLAAGTAVLDLTAYVGGSSEARVAFEIAGPNSSQIQYWEVDTVEVLAGAPPVLAAVPNGSVTSGGTQQIAVSATDLDTAAGALAFSLVGAPAWASIAPVGDGTATITLSPPNGSAGTYSNVRVQVSDGQFVDSRTFQITVVPDTSEQVATVTIRTQPGGGGSEADSATLSVGDTLQLFAAGYNSTGTYLNDVPCVWATAGTLDAVSGTASAALIFSPTSADTSGIITATPTNGAITGDSTGTITVQAAVGGGVDLAASTITVSPAAIVANGSDTATISVALFDSVGAPANGVTVAISSTKGTLLGSVVAQGGGVYTQAIRSDATEGVASITATADGQPLANAAIVQFVTYIPLSSPLVINCNNYSQYQNKNLSVSSQVEFNANATAAHPNGCAPMRFGDIVVQSGGVMKHGVASATNVYTLDISVRSLLVNTGGLIDVTGLGYLGSLVGSSNGYVYPNNDSAGAPENVGGSHGGMGGRDTVDRTYGSYVNPSTPGGGGGYNIYISRTGGEGGGVIRIAADTSIVVHGAIRANGNNGQYDQGAGGAGGSISLTTPFLGGTGTIEANGGTGYSSTVGAGGGGRIAIRGYQSLAGSFAPSVVATNIRARTGSSNASIAGGAGTIYLLSTTDTYGSLIVDNNGWSAPDGSTPIPIVPPGVINQIDGQTVVDFAALWRGDFFEGTFVIPNVDQAGMATGPGSVTLFQVASHSDFEMLLSGGTLSSQASVLDNYRGVLALDRLDIRGKASVFVDGDTVVTSGNLINPTPGRLRMDGDLQTSDLDIHTLTSMQVSNGDLSFGRLYSLDVTDTPVAWEIATATVTADDLHADGLQITASSTLTAGTLDVALSLDCTSSTIAVQSTSAGSASLTSCTTDLGPTEVGDSLFATNGSMVVSTLDVGNDATFTGSFGLTVTDNTIVVADRLELQDTATIGHPTTEPGGDIKSIEIDAHSVVIGAGTKLDASGKGFKGGTSAAAANAGYGEGNNNVFGAQNLVAGSHGGLGSGATPQAVYDAYTFPTQPGGGGGFLSSVGSEGGRGGGLIVIQAATTVRVDGTIEANGRGTGESTSASSNGGAGGTIRIHAAVLAGNGTIRANGYNGYNNSSYQGAGGGGGRVAILDYTQRKDGFAGAAVVSSIKAYGGNGYSTKDGGAGTIYLRSATQTWGELIVDNNNLAAPAQSTPIVVVPEGTVSGVTAASISDGAAGWLPSRFAGSWVNPNVAQGQVGDTLIDHKLFFIDDHGYTKLNLIGSTAVSSVAEVGDTYRAVLPVDRLEVRGRAHLYVDGDIVVRFGGITSPDPSTMLLEGTIEGKIIDFNDVGTLDANNGGIIAEVVYTQGTDDFPLDIDFDNSTLTLPSLNTTNFTVTGGNLTIGDVTVNGQAMVTGATLTTGDLTITGAATFVNSTVTAGRVGANSVSISGGTLAFDRLVSASNIILDNNAAVTIHDAVVQAPTTLQLSGSADLYHCESDATKECRLQITAGSVLVDSGSYIDANGRGYVGGLSGQAGYTTGNQNLNGPTENLGGSHGGMGGYSNAGQVYDSIFLPNQPGSGGGPNAGHQGGDGGGVIYIQAASFVSIAGSVRADGLAGLSGYGSGGAGGSIVINTPNLNIEASGYVDAFGGNGRNSSSDPSGGGGGGRIALIGLVNPTGFAAETELHAHVRVRGGNGYSTNRGGAGTVFIKRTSQTYGSLLIDNDFYQTESGSTPLPMVPQRVSTSVAGSTLTDIGASLKPGAFVGYHLNPNVDQANSATGLSQQSLFRVVSNTIDQLSLTGPVSLGSVATPGDTYRGVLILDNLEIRDGAKVQVAGDVWVRQGDLTSGDPTSFRLGGELDAGVLDLGSADYLHLDSGALIVDQLFSHQVDDYAFDWQFTSAHGSFPTAVYLPQINAATVDLDAGEIHTGALTVAGDFTGNGTAAVFADQLSVGGASIWNNISTAIGLFQPAGLVDITGGSHVMGQVAAGPSFALRGNAQLEIAENLLDVTGNFEMRDSSRLTHCESTETKTCRLLLTADAVVVDSSAWIDVEGRGYVGGTPSSPPYTYPNVPAQGTAANYYRVGGSHGGLGGYAPDSDVFDSYVDPQWPGGGGGYPNSTGGTGGDGGGAVLVEADTSIIVHGQIRAIGGSGTSAGPSGAGGTINLKAPFVGGSGYLYAHAQAATASSTYDYGGGSGGRIAIVADSIGGSFAADSSDLATRVRVYGGNAETDGGSGTYFVKSAADTYGRLYLENNDNNTGAVTPITVMPQGYVLGINGGTRKITDYGANWGIDQFANTWVNLDIHQPNSNQGLSQQTFLPVGSNTTNTMTLAGAAALNTSIGKTYRGVLPLDELTVDRRAHLRVDSDVLVLGGNVGTSDPSTFLVNGIIEVASLDLNATTALDIQSNGAILADEIFANGQADFAFDTVLNGGSLVEDNIRVHNLTVTGTTTITADTFVATGDVEFAGGNPTLSLSNMEVAGTLTFTSMPSRVLGIVDASTFIMNGGTLTMDRLLVDGDATMTSNASLTIADNYVTVGGHLDLQDSAALLHAPCDTTTIRTLAITANQLSVASSARLDARGAGFVGISANGYTIGNQNVTGSGTRAGGSHGGLGGRGNSNQNPSTTYGSLYDPQFPGSGGGYGSSGDGGDGGGVIRANIAGTITLDGTIYADGQNHTTYGAGGAGGSVRLDCATLQGGGAIYAVGEPGYGSYSGGGGGGRVALYAGTLQGDFQLATLVENVFVQGGAGWSTFDGGSGTIYVKTSSSTYGDLFMDNANQATVNQEYSPLPSVAGTVASLPGADQIQVTGATWESDQLAGTWVTLNANTADGAGLSNDTAYQVLTNTADTLVLDVGVDVATLVSVGQPVRSIYRFDNLQLRDRATLFAHGDVLVLNGDYESGDNSTLAVPANSRLTCGNLDANGATVTGDVVATIVP